MKKTKKKRKGLGGNMTKKHDINNLTTRSWSSVAGEVGGGEPWGSLKKR